MRKFVGGDANTITGGAFRPEDLQAALLCGYIREASPRDARDQPLTAGQVAARATARLADLPGGWRVIAGRPTRDEEPEPPEEAQNAILMGWVRVNPSQAPYPMWLYQDASL